ncbi:ADIPOR-like receptor C43G2.1 [Actinoplanes sp. SE50]|uniref:PAQR family membrane homeostasis protein TrhA n=1 Tax=unclassified Actinoplanes TaxID=2626549 RepID=UPI00023ECC0A|nr:MULTISPECIES: hemolysin III family protein [unclassified Actinoplanes]AEV81555.1 ADIPOR-like receptor C43G2.1 [Actinoplanes sp. SE50/110]ATO79957.1 ADIPOR-like receptor C43G2.1 [Actinoplanes sp. SE50]SLL97359.1 ADIPOR-like receptor [Actinoplanes sp. SE50/110]
MTQRTSPGKLRRPIWRGWIHLIWFLLSLPAGGLLIAGARGEGAVVAAAVYAGTVSAMFGTSALYHRVSRPPALRRLLQRLDHLMIFVLIAGSATPPYQLAVPARYHGICLVVMWALAAVTATLHVARMQAPERAVGGTYIGLAAVAGLALPLIWIHAGPAAGALAVAGGLLYVAGALAYHYRRPDPAPSVFGYHEVFHALVSAGATCHYAAVFMLVT